MAGMPTNMVNARRQSKIAHELLIILESAQTANQHSNTTLWTTSAFAQPRLLGTQMRTDAILVHLVAILAVRQTSALCANRPIFSTNQRAPANVTPPLWTTTEMDVRLWAPAPMVSSTLEIRLVRIAIQAVLNVKFWLAGASSVKLDSTC